jgi:dTDP-glucose 4,6-dehydratase
MARLVVTGGMGFIGSAFVRRCLAAGEDDILVVDKLTYAGNLNNLKGFRGDRHLSFIKGDVCDRGLMNRVTKDADAIVHFAAETHVDRSILESGDFVRSDVVGTWSVLEACRRNDVGRMLQISTDEVYGEARGHPSTELDLLMPKSPYAASKAAADRLAFSYFTTYGLPVIISRCTNNYGPYQHPEKLIPLFVTNALEDKPLPVYGTGKNTRDWIHVDDHCAALDLLLKAKGLEGEVLNVGTSEERSVLQIGEAILKNLVKPKTLLVKVPDRPGHVLRHAVEWSKLRERTGWAPKKPFDVGLFETIDWYRANEWWWRPIKGGNLYTDDRVQYYTES